VVSDVWGPTAMNDLRIQRVSFPSESMTVEFSDGRTICVPLSYFRVFKRPRHPRATSGSLSVAVWAFTEPVDEDLSVENVLLAYSRSKKEAYAKAAPM